jgi:hypothetical protein
MSKLNPSRRLFVQSLPVLAGVAALGSLANAEERRRAKKADGAAAGGKPALVPVNPATDAMAKSVNYVEVHADMKKAELKTERQGVKWDEQFCNNCQLNVVIAGQTERMGCTLFSGKSVAAKGWCSSWAKKS